MSLQTQINAIDCGSKGNLGTGLAGCRIDRKRVTALGLLQKGFKFTEEISKDYMRTLQQEGKLIMLQGVVSFEDATADDNIITRAGSGIKVVAGKNPYEYTATFDNGINFHKALTSLSGFNAYDLILFDVDNSMFFTVTKQGQPKGFTLGMFENGKYMGANGTDASTQTIAMQLTERAEVDERMSYVTTENLDFSYDELDGVNEVIVSVDPIVTASTSIVVSALLQDKTHAVEGLLVADFKVTRNGSALVPSAVSYNATTKKYTLTVTANTTADIVTVELNGIILTLADVLYKSNTATAVVTAV
jgi:hypothetical protein